MSQVPSIQERGFLANVAGRKIARNTLWNLVGQVSPSLVAVFAIPLLVTGLGTDRFGVLTLVWMGIGYFSLFDLGLGRSLTQLVAEKLGVGQEQEIPALVWTGLFLMMLSGLIGALIASLLSPWLVREVLKIPNALQYETLQALYVLALSTPIVISTAALRGVLEAYQRFDIINVVRGPMGIVTFLGPLLVLPFSKSLFLSTGVLAASRLVFWLIHLLLCLRHVPALRQEIAFKPSMVGPLIRFGSWMTVTNLVSPLMSYLDRFLIAAMISVASVAYYTTPFEIVTKLGIIPGALVGVLFPTFAATFAQSRSDTARLFGRGVKYVFLALFPLSLLIVAFGHKGLYLWLGADFAEHGTSVLQWLAIAVFINGLAQVPFALIQGVGRPDLTAKLHLVELPFYLLLLWWLAGARGIEGVAIAWLVRVVVDTLLLVSLASMLLPTAVPFIQRMAVITGAAALVLWLAMLSMGPIVKGLFVVCSTLTYAVVAWGLILDPEERAQISDRLKLKHVEG